MIRYISVSLGSGILFGILDGVIHANRFAQSLYEVYNPIARNTVDPVAGILIDLLYGFVMAGVFLLLNKSLPGATGIAKGLSFACLVWFFRVVMNTASQWMIFNIPAGTLIYSLLTESAEILILGIIYGLSLKPGSGVSKS
jgi:hypothetical protein